MQFNIILHVIRLPFAWNLYVVVCHSNANTFSYYLTRHSYVLVCDLYPICMSLVCARISVCHSYVIPMPLVCTRMSLVCHSYVLECHQYVTRMHWYAIRMSLVCDFNMNPFFYFFLLKWQILVKFFLYVAIS